MTEEGTMHLGFSYIGLIFLLMLMIPNIIWTKFQPENYEHYAKNENKALQILENDINMIEQVKTYQVKGKQNENSCCRILL